MIILIRKREPLMLATTPDFKVDPKEALRLRLFEVLDGDKYDLNLERKYSNSITSIDLIPRFYRGYGAIKPVADLASNTVSISNNFSIQGKDYTCRVQPAVIQRIDRKTKEKVEFYALPSDAEELIEKVIFLIASTNGLERKSIGGITRYGTSFSLYEIKKYLQLMGKTKSYEQIRESLTIIRDSKTRISQTDQNNPKRRAEITHDVWSDAVLELEGNGRGRDRCYIGFSDFVVQEISNLSYRQILFSRLTCYGSTFSRYLDLYLSSMWTSATLDRKEPISLLRIMESFGKPQVSIVTKRRDMRAALLDLLEKNVIKTVPSPIKKRINDEEFDYLYYLEPTDHFVEEMIISNGKLKGLKSLSNKITEDEIKELPDKVGRVYSDFVCPDTNVI